MLFRSNPDTSPFLIDANGTTVIGHTARISTATYGGGTANANINVIGTTTSDTGIAMAVFNSGIPGQGPVLSFNRSGSSTKGTHALPSGSSTDLGGMSFAASNGTNFVTAAALYSYVESTPTASSMPGRLVFSTTASGSTLPTERMRIDSAGVVTVAGSIKWQNAIATTTAAPTIASATTIAPTAYITFISGTTAIATITAPSTMTGGGQIVLIPTGAWTTNTTGNIALATTAVVNRALTMTYDSTTTKWYPSY